MLKGKEGATPYAYYHCLLYFRHLSGGIRDHLVLGCPQEAVGKAKQPDIFRGSAEPAQVVDHPGKGWFRCVVCCQHVGNKQDALP